MPTHYSVLGIDKNATDAEIKTAFRKLAKLYHPDKNANNPHTKTLFEVTLKAYQILSNPYTRKRYDEGYAVTTTSKSNRSNYKSKHTQWTFTEQQKKERAYYQTYYKSKIQQTPYPKSPTYSDYKYVLFATPLAVALMMLVVYLFTDKPTIKTPPTIKQYDTIAPKLKNSIYSK